MGWDAYNEIPGNVKQRNIEAYLLMLGFARGKSYPRTSTRSQIATYYFQNNIDYRYLSGLHCELFRDFEKDGVLVLRSHSTLNRSKADCDLHNKVIRGIRDTFGGFFHSDFGRNRYFHFDGVTRDKAEAGVYIAFARFAQNIRRAELLLDTIETTGEGGKFVIAPDSPFNEFNPRVLCANLIVPFAVASIEEFFRSSYVAMLQYSAERDKILKKTKMSGTELVSIVEGKSTLLESVARWMSFQDLDKINDVFRELKTQYDIQAVLRRPYGNRSESSWDMLKRLVDQRHAMIHKGRLMSEYHSKQTSSDLKLLYKSIWRVYQRIITVEKWNAVEQSEF